MPTWAIGALMILIALVTAVGGVLIVRHFIDVRKLKQHHDIAGPIFSTLGVVYAVLLAFVIVIVWQDFDRTQNDVLNEANYYADIYRDSNGLSEPFRSELLASYDDYINAIIVDEWPRLARGERSMIVQEKSDKNWKLYAGYSPKTDVEKIYYEEILTKMNDAGELRRTRIIDAGQGVHPVLWAVLLLGGFITVAFTFFFGSENLGAQLIMTTLLAVVIALILFTILIMDFPYTGDMAIQPAAFQQILANLKR
jgi:hypothetical protein